MKRNVNSLRLGLTVVLGLLLVGCGKHYWNKPGAIASDFNRDSAECARENSVQMTANKDYGIVIADLYKLCLQSRGWNRAQQLEPVPAGWFRGIEEDGPMKLEPPAPQPATPRSDLPDIPATTAAELIGTWTGELIRTSPTAHTSNPAILRIFEEGSGLRGSLQVRGFDLTGSGDVVKSGREVSLSGKFGQRALPITFSLVVSGTALQASGLAANNTIYRLSFQKR